MIKVLLPVLMAVSVVLSGNPDAKELQSQISGGIAYPSSGEAHSFYHKSIPCDKKAKWIGNYKLLKDKKVPLPEILKIYDKEGDQKNCHIFFKNLFVLNLNIYHNVHLFTEFFKTFVEAYKEVSIISFGNISLDSFAYEPSTRRYVFIDIEEFNPTSKHNENTDMERQFVENFLETLNDKKIVLTETDLKELNELTETNNTYGNNLLQTFTVDKLTVRENISSNTNSSSSFSLTIDIEDNGTHFGLKVSHASKTISFKSIRKADSFAFFICNKGYKVTDIECSVIDEKDAKSKYNLKYPISDDEIVDFEVQESYTQANDWNKEDQRIFYEIFIIIKNKKVPGITQSLTYYTPSSSLEIKDNDLVLCETTSNKVLILYTKNKKEITRNYLIDYTYKTIMSSSEIIQISPHHIKGMLSEYNFQFKRIFYISQAANKTIFTYDIYGEYIRTISIKKFEVDSGPLYLKQCDGSFSGISFSADITNRKLEYKSETKTFPSSIVFIDHLWNTILKFVCFKENLGDVSILTFGDTSLKDNSFVWNFNMDYREDGNKSKLSVVNYIQLPKVSILNFEFKNFAWPIAKPYVAYISIFYHTDFKQYIIQVVFFKENVQLFNVYNEKRLTSNYTPSLPVNLSYSKTSTDPNPSKELFRNYDAVYLSPTEVIYQFEALELKNCNPGFLVSDKENFIQIWCTPSDNESKNVEISNLNNLTEGLKVVNTQGKPTASGEKQKSTDTNKKEERVARVLV